MIVYPDINPVAFSVFGWSVHWYGLMYMAAFGVAIVMGRYLLKQESFADLRTLEMDDMMLAGIIGVLGGGRLGYVLFYNPSLYAAQPLQIFSVWDGGMSFHGGLLGVITALFIYAKRGGFDFWRVMDFAAVLTPLGLGLGRLGNFINGELPGRIASSELPWRVVFSAYDDIARHPSSLYQAILEGAVLALVMWLLALRRRRAGFLSASFLIGYAACRLFSEQFREPDAHIGFLLGGFSMGQLLSIPMLLFGIALLFRHRWRLSSFGGDKKSSAAGNGSPSRRGKKSKYNKYK